MLFTGWHENISIYLKDEWFPDCRISIKVVDSSIRLSDYQYNSEQDKNEALNIYNKTGSQEE